VAELVVEGEFNPTSPPPPPPPPLELVRVELKVDPAPPLTFKRDPALRVIEV
jgi:hypothetical protein